MRIPVAYLEGSQPITKRGAAPASATMIAKVAIGGYHAPMNTVSIKIAKDEFTKLVRRAEAGETVVVTRNGKPVADIVPHKEKKGGIDYEGGRAFLESLGIEDPFPYVADDFDDPLPEDFLIRPLPFD